MLMKHSTRDGQRPGIVLLVVMAMLALFAVVALSFVYYAESEATASRYAAQAQTMSRADIDPELLLSYYLSQLIYDTNNQYSAMRGHSLARNMYGYNPLAWNVTPYNGVGRLRYPVTFLQQEPNSNSTPSPSSMNNMVLINYQNFSQQPNMQRNPEMDQNGTYRAGNVHWTYPDLNNMFLAAVTGNGDVLIPSFYRPWVQMGRPGSVWNKYLSLRPESPQFSGITAWNPTFNPPDWDGGGDVKNLEWGNGTMLGTYAGGPQVNNDSIWMDLGFPVLTAPNGKRFKPLFAALIVDLDNKINLYAHGNIMNAVGKTAQDIVSNASKLLPGSPHASNQGWGPWEVNPSQVLSAFQPANPVAPAQQLPTEWLNLFIGANSVARYGSGAINPPALPAQFSPLYNYKAQQLALPQPANVVAPYYSQTSFGAPPAQSGSITYPTTAIPATMLQAYPSYVGSWDTGAALAIASHPAAYSPFVNGLNNRAALVMSQIEALYRYQGTGGPAMTSDVFAFLPNNMKNAKMRWLSTLRSSDLDRPGLLPFNWKASSAYTLTGSNASLYPTIPTNPNPSTTNPNLIKFPEYPLPSPPAAEFDSTNGTNSWGSTVYNKSQNGFNQFGNQLRVMLNRPLRPYPAPRTAPNTSPPDPAYINNTKLAVQDRQNMATELYGVLIQLTGAQNPNLVPTLAPTDPQYLAARWLAQLAVNIVDFIDEDDYMTPFPWNKNAAQDVLFGTELAHLVLNEVYAQVDNDASDPGIWATAPATPKASTNTTTGTQKYPYRVNFWIELHNPMKYNPHQPPSSSPPLTATFPRYGGRAQLSEYRVVVTPVNGTTPNNFLNSASATVQKFFTTAQPEGALNTAMPIQSVPASTSSPAPSAPDPPTTLQYFTQLPLLLQYVDPITPQALPITPPTTYGSAQITSTPSPPPPYPAAPPAPYQSGCYLNQGFYVMGPLPPQYPVGSPTQYQKRYLAGRDPALPVSQAPVFDQNGALVVDTTLTPPKVKVQKALFPELSLPVSSTNNGSTNTAGNPLGDITYAVFLQRLANPSLPPQTNPALTSPPYNPYVTIDYWTGITNVDNTMNGGQLRYSGGSLAPSALHSGVVYSTAGAVTPPPPSPSAPPSGTVLAWRSMAKSQPYMNKLWNVTQTTVANPPPSYPLTTFFTHNGSRGTLFPQASDKVLSVPFYAPIHLDRRLVNPVELLNVSCYPPWQYTQMFGIPPSSGGDQRHPWDVQETLLYRLLELVQNTPLWTQVPNPPTSLTAVPPPVPPVPTTPYPAPPPYQGGSPVTGKININTVWDPEILAALVDGASVNGVTVNINAPTGINNPLFYALLGSRSPNLTYQSPPQSLAPYKAFGPVGPTREVVNSALATEYVKAYSYDVPFKSFNVGVYSSGTDLQYPNTLGLEDTLLRHFTSIDPKKPAVKNITTSLFQPADPVQTAPPNYRLPFSDYSVLSKIYNNVTLRSNVFALWLTVGFFEVTDETVNPPRLGAEIGRAENRHVRHRMFAVIDRTNLLAPNMLGYIQGPIAKGGGTQNVTIPSRNPVPTPGTTGKVTFNLFDPVGGQVQIKPMQLVSGMQLAVWDQNWNLNWSFQNPPQPPTGPPKEIVTITVTGIQVQAIFRGTYSPSTINPIVMVWSPIPPIPGPANFPNSVLGNPGPQEGSFDVRQNTLVVPYFSIIQ